jgi:hypothetical protein
MLQLTRTSQMSGIITATQLWNYTNGGYLLQNAFPNLDADKREFVKSGVTAEEWEELFG